MGRPFKRVQIYGVLGAAIFLWAGLIACSNSNEPEAPEVFISVNENMVTVDAYLREVDDVAADVLTGGDPEKDMMANIHLRVLNQITERLIVFERARELGVDINDQELDAHVDSVKADYPQGEFEQVLLEQAVSYAEWKNNMRTRLLMRKVIDLELEPNIQVKPEEISAYYEQHYAASEHQPNKEADTSDLETKILQQVRNKKKEALYRDWLENLKRRYKVHVNQAVWDRIIAHP